MAHEITSTDGLVLTGQRAWHGLGRVVESAPTPREALELAGLGWSVVESAGVSGPVELGGEMVRLATDTHKLLVRSDSREVLGVVEDGYKPVQNAELAEFAAALADEGDVCRVESAGSIRGGKRVWFLVRGESFSVGSWGKDEVHRYLLIANGHDGSLAVTCQPTSIRVVCSNTLHMSLGRGKATAVRFKHEGDVASKLDEARRALKLFHATGKEFAETARNLSARTMSRDELQRFYLDVYSAVEEPLPAAPKTDRERRAVRDAHQVIGQWARNFDRERSLAGETAWNALNSVTRWVDHQRNYRAAPAAKREARIYGAIWGTGAEQKATVATMAAALV